MFRSPAHEGRRFATAAMIVFAVLAAAASVHADPPEATSPSRDAPSREPVDTTRLDVARLPPEAGVVTRDMFAHGLRLEIGVGARGFIGGLGRFTTPGLYVRAGIGYEVASWFFVGVAGEGGFHQSSAPPPPDRVAVSLVCTTLDARFQAEASTEVALFLAAQVGLAIALGEVLLTYGFQNATSVGLAYGGEIGFDYHPLTRHVSLGLAAGARRYSNFERDNEPAIGIHGLAYLRYVF